MVFSGAVKIGDLNDFIAPSQACVVALQDGKPAEIPAADAHVRLHARQPPGKASGGGFKQTYTEGDAGAVKVTLQDCLACSGCVTSAETVLLQHQSRAEFEAKLREPGVVVVVSIAPQSRASLSVLHGLSPWQVQAKLAAALSSMGVAAVLDVGEARELTRAEAAAEFVERYRRSRECGSSSAGSSTPQLPVLASACPGWVCYAEKTHPELLPHLSAVKSPQAVAGTFVKRALAAQRGWDPGLVYHCSVMPCYDKKLEASREDLRLPGSAVPEVDSCLTTGELQEVLDAAGVTLAALPDGPTLRMADAFAAADSPPTVGGRPDDASRGRGGSCSPTAHAGSGGYLEHVFRAAAVQLHAITPPPGPLQLHPGRNPDLREAELLEAATGRPLLRFASAYGFRNIQALVRKAKTGRCPYEYVEVMACPGGCLNGAGQLKPRAGETPAQLLERLEMLYHLPEEAGTCGAAAGPASGAIEAAGARASNADSGGASDSVSAATRTLYKRWVGGPPGSDAAKALLHTQFHKRERTMTSAISDW